MVKIKFMNEEKDYVEAVRICTYGTLWAKIDLVLGIGVLIFGLIFMALNGIREVYFWMVLIGIAGLSIRVLGYYVMPKIRFRNETKYKYEYEITFDESRLKFKTTQMESKVDWSIYKKLIETEYLFIMIYGSREVTIIPKSAFESDIDQMTYRNLATKYINKVG